jgi:drug/metabolite transporter (DMT)-like permease
MQNRTVLGIIFLCAGVFVFSLQDGIIKALSSEYSVTEAVYIRSVVAIPLLAILVHWEAGIGTLASPNYWWLALRAFALFASYIAYYLAFPALPLADAVALFFIAPLFISVLAGPVLGERVGWRSWVAVAIGTTGVLVMLRPGTGFFEPAALLSVFSALLYAAGALSTRRLGTTELGSVMTFYQNIIFFVGAGLIALVLGGIPHPSHPSLDFLLRPWVLPQVTDLLLMASCGVVATVGTLLLTHAYRVAEVSRLGPFEYTGMLWGPVWGFFIFGEVPRVTTIAGGLLIVFSGLVVALQPRKVASRPHAADVPSSELLSTLYEMSLIGPDQYKNQNSLHVYQLCDLGYLIPLGPERYSLTGEGEAILKKASYLSPSSA